MSAPLSITISTDRKINNTFTTNYSGTYRPNLKESFPYKIKVTQSTDNKITMTAFVILNDVKNQAGLNLGPLPIDQERTLNAFVNKPSRFKVIITHVTAQNYNYVLSFKEVNELSHSGELNSPSASRRSEQQSSKTVELAKAPSVPCNILFCHHTHHLSLLLRSLQEAKLKEVAVEIVRLARDMKNGDFLQETLDLEDFLSITDLSELLLKFTALHQSEKELIHLKSIQRVCRLLFRKFYLLAKTKSQEPNDLKSFMEILNPYKSYGLKINSEGAILLERLNATAKEEYLSALIDFYLLGFILQINTPDLRRLEENLLSSKFSSVTSLFYRSLLLQIIKNLRPQSEVSSLEIWERFLLLQKGEEWFSDYFLFYSKLQDKAEIEHLFSELSKKTNPLYHPFYLCGIVFRIEELYFSRGYEFSDDDTYLKILKLMNLIAKQLTTLSLERLFDGSTCDQFKIEENSLQALLKDRLISCLSTCVANTHGSAPQLEEQALLAGSLLITRQEIQEKAWEAQQKRPLYSHKLFKEAASRILPWLDQAHKLVEEVMEDPQLKKHEDYYIPMRAIAGKLSKAEKMVDIVNHFVEAPEEKILVLQGRPGSGKSFICRILAKHYLENFHIKNMFPIVVSVPAMTPPPVSPVLFSKDKSFRENTSFLIFLDALDEVFPHLSLNLLVSTWLQRFPRAKIIVTCREDYFTSSPSKEPDVKYKTYHLCPFDEKKLKKFCQKHILACRKAIPPKPTPMTAENIFSFIQQRPQLKSIAADPLFARVLAEIAPNLKYWLVNHSEGNAVVTIADVLDAYFCFTVERELLEYDRTRKTKPPGITDKIQYLDYSIKIAVIFQKSPGQPITSLSHSELLTKHRDLFDDQTYPLNYWLRRCSPIYKHQDVWTFMNPIYIEYFALLQRSSSNSYSRYDEVARRLRDNEFSEVFKDAF